MVPARALGLLLCVQLCGGSGELRLVDGGGRCAGRVEVKHEGEWGSVCSYDFDWDHRGAGVVCRQLGCGAVARASPYAPFGQGKGRIWLHPFCRGGEATLQECLHFGWGQHFCSHEWDVGVTCTEALELRLVAGRGPCEGRVEVKLRGHWGTVADDSWDMEDAEVVCQQMGCGSAASAYHSSESSQTDGLVSLAVVDCDGNEKALWDCKIQGWGPYIRPTNYKRAVVCQGFSRLTGGAGACSGRLEVRQGRAWATVCHGHVDLKAAQVVCRELGCGTAVAVPSAGHFGAATGPLWDSAFECNGSEPLLAKCARRPSNNQSCAGPASVVCSPYTGFRLADGGSGCAGRVEVEAQGTWGPLCATAWDLPDAHVLCRHLGCGPAASLPPGGHFGTGTATGPLQREALSCSGSERHPGECPVAVLGEPACPPGHAAAVNCSGAAEPLRLLDGESRCDGRLDVATRPGAWASVSAGPWDDRAASVACRQLGCGVPEKVYAVPAASWGPVELQELRCAGTEERLAQCNASGPAAAPSHSPTEAAVACSGSRRLRLAGGPGRCAGRVEVYTEGTWGSVCQDAWDLPDADVVCRQLGCGRAREAPGSERFGPGVGTLWPGAGGCSGTEAALWDCPAPARRGCRRGGGAAAVCSGLLRLAGGQQQLQRAPGGAARGDVGPRVRQRHQPRHSCRCLPPAGLWHRGEAGGRPRRGLGPRLAGLGAMPGGGPPRSGAAPRRPGTCSPAAPPGSPTSPVMRTPRRRAGPPPLQVPAGVTSSVAPLTAVSGSVPVPTVLCVLLGTLLGLALAALAVQAHRARVQRRDPIRAKDAGSEVVYEELDYSLMPEYQEVPSHTGSLSKGSGMKLQDENWDSNEEEESKPGAAPALPAQPGHGPPGWLRRCCGRARGAPPLPTAGTPQSSPTGTRAMTTLTSAPWGQRREEALGTRLQEGLRPQGGVALPMGGHPSLPSPQHAAETAPSARPHPWPNVTPGSL
ncbi:LOW QUALITY PROTEIN: scavenger receptor cysteine-rich type 1 protein M130-like [Oxyura jamaicensis]|uniref:LOW QUALITY PROTEIN: scavenger receptor cysteine-rich type 1 protein M130-like n=1 Tax=Oxyura jamaicensis TaxID=8884 RepID=UPI0015A60CC7|nr:LOW QUALITY PROTEIN: scavenger receptor cysteine-rich type 1 protein M130-like [Oxyura jamaicensis]